ncbi:hypothetical protein [Streptomyces sp. NPDC003435]
MNTVALQREPSAVKPHLDVDDQDFGACDQYGRQYARPPAEDEPLDPAWRPIDLTRDSFEDWAAKDRAPWPRYNRPELRLCECISAPFQALQTL